MNSDFIIKIAVFTVGVTSMLKQLLEVKNAKLKILATVIVGALGGVLLCFLPEKVFLTVVGVSVAVVFYDSILKLMEKMLKGLER